jgi:hypothetical protein
MSKNRKNLVLSIGLKTFEVIVHELVSKSNLDGFEYNKNLRHRTLSLYTHKICGKNTVFRLDFQHNESIQGQKYGVFSISIH